MKKAFLVIILVVAAFLRFYQLGTNPPSLTWDEVAWGYNAYSLGIDGRDEFGRFLPYDYLESFGDFKPPMYAYLSIIPVKLFGLTEFATRFASAFFGVLTVLLTYFLVKEIFKSRKSSSHQVIKSKEEKNRPEDFKTLRLYDSILPMLAAFLLAISPWHIMLSRAAFEANVATFFLVSGVFLFLRGVYKNPWLLSLSAVAFVASMYTFNTSRIVAPLLVIMLVIGFWRKLLVYKKQTATAVVIGLAVLLPIVPFLMSDQAKLRFKEVNIFTDARVVNVANQQIQHDNGAWWSKIIHNRRLGYGVSYVKHYFDNLSPDFLFIKGDGNPKFSIQSMGQMYLWELPFFIAGILFLFRRKEGSWWIIPLWLVLGIIPAATARETPHALRIETTLPTFQILVAYGVVQVFSLISNFKFQISNLQLKYVIFGCFLLGVLFNLVYFVENYFVHYKKEFAREWQYGYKDALTYAKEVEAQYDTIYITQELGRPYAYALFYLQYDPTLFRQNAVVQRDAFGFVAVKSFDKYVFDGDNIKDKKNVLYIDTPSNVPGTAAIKNTFYLPDGEVALVAYTLN